MTKPRDPKPLPTAEEVRALLSYRPDSGTLTWLPRPGTTPHERRWNTRYAGKQAGSLGEDGYVHVSVFDRLYRSHRLAWVWMTGEWPDQIDHVNGIRHDNRFANLRLANASLNQANTKLYSTNEAGRKGVRRAGWRYRARIMVKGKHHYLGGFATAEEAHRAYCEAAQRFFGAYARAA
jgi:hypothetical protein